MIYFLVSVRSDLNQGFFDRANNWAYTYQPLINAVGLILLPAFLLLITGIVSWTIQRMQEQKLKQQTELEEKRKSNEILRDFFSQVNENFLQKSDDIYETGNYRFRDSIKHIYHAFLSYPGLDDTAISKIIVHLSKMHYISIDPYREKSLSEKYGQLYVVPISGVTIRNFRFPRFSIFYRSFFQYSQVSYVAFQNTEFGRAIFSFSILYFTSFYSSLFECVCFQNVTVKQSSFFHCCFTKIQFRRSIFWRNKCRVDNFNGASFSCSGLYWNDFGSEPSREYSQFCRVNFSYVTFVFNCFDFTNMRDCSFDSVTFSSNFLDSDYHRNLSACYDKWLDWRDTNTIAPLFKRHSFRGTNLQNARFRNSVLRFMDFTGADLVKADFQGVRFDAEGIHFQGVPHVDFSYANLSYANFHGVNFSLEKPDSPRATYLGLSWRKRQSFANFKNANLYRANFCYADLSCATNLTYEQLSQAYLWQTKLPTYLKGKIDPNKDAHLQRMVHLLPPVSRDRHA